MNRPVAGMVISVAMSLVLSCSSATPTAAPQLTATATSQPTYTNTPSPTATNTPVPVVTAKPVSRFGDFYLSSPCPSECEMENWTTLAGSRQVAFKQNHKTPILYSGGDGYYVKTYSGQTIDYISVFDRAGYIIDYMVPKASWLFKEGPVNISRGQPIAESREFLPVLKTTFRVDANYSVGMKKFSGGDESTVDVLQLTSRVDLYTSDFARKE